jgi:hypothetical protein
MPNSSEVENAAPATEQPKRRRRSAPNTVSVNQIAAILRDALPVLKAHGITLRMLIETAGDLLPVLRKHGVQIPPEVDRYLPLVILLFEMRD